MSNVQSRLSKFSRRALETSGLVILIVLLALPFTRAFADDYRYGRGGPAFIGGSQVDGWRLGGAYRGGGYEIWQWFRGDWRRMPGRAIQIGGNPRSPWVVNSQGERYQWTGRDWRFVGYAGGRGYDRRFSPPPPVFRNDRDRNHWDRNRGNRNDRYYGRYDNRRDVIERQRDRIERQQDRIQDLREDRRRDRIEDRRDDNRNRDQGQREQRRSGAGDRDGRRDNDRDGQARGDQGGRRP